MVVGGKIRGNAPQLADYLLTLAGEQTHYDYRRRRQAGCRSGLFKGYAVQHGTEQRTDTQQQQRVLCVYQSQLPIPPTAP